MQVLRNRLKTVGPAFAPLLSAALIFVVLLCGSAVSADPVSTTPHAPPIASADFGSPPSGEIPILYNDHTVYTKPDILRKSRVLAAFVKDHQIYVPLRSMFEQMGATVTASADGKTFTAAKPGTSVSVRLGSSEVTINGETRPLDVPPMVYQGVVLVTCNIYWQVGSSAVLGGATFNGNVLANTSITINASIFNGRALAQSAAVSIPVAGGSLITNPGGQ